MTDTEDPPLDEIQWRSPPHLQEMGGIQTNTVLPYFSASPFFDPTSNNATLMTQALYNASMYHILQTRAAFEERLRSMSGLEFMVSHDPSEGGMKVENSGVWVIRKQVRRKTAGRDEVTVLAVYFVVGEFVYMAPKVGDVLGGRVLSTVTSLTKLLSTASTLPIFTPALGNTYFPPVPKGTSASTAPGSLAATQASKEVTPMPDAQAQVSFTSSKNSLSPGKASGTDIRGTALLSGSLSLASRYVGEYMDETPLVGEPGAFILQKVREGASQSQSQSQQQSLSASQATSKSSGGGSVGVGGGGAAGGSAGGGAGSGKPPPLKTENLPPAEKKGRAGEKTPVTPGTAGREKKRKKSKAAIPTAVGTPR
ncbi:Mediator of RNA polymerase II transcription subunit 6 [Trapelia coarctata]|nr:Mediator of RNA polymerase II transcription subunit 6 [Trapelia coarctata]